MNKKGILAARIDPDLIRTLGAEVARSIAADPTASESVVVRQLLREALAARAGRPLLAADQGYREGWLRGFGESKKALQQALHGSAPFEKRSDHGQTQPSGTAVPKGSRPAPRSRT